MRAVLLVILACISYANATTAGQRFQLVFLENIVEAPKDMPLEVHVTNSGGNTASVTVSSPLTQCASVTGNVGPNQSQKFNVCWWMRLVKLDYWPAYKTVLVESTQNVFVYAFNKELFSADGYYAIPVNELAYSYYVAAYDEANIATQCAISGTEDATSVRIELPTTADLPVEVNYRGMKFTNGQSYTISLNQYETYLAQSRGDLTGARITANKPIAVFSGNIRNKDSFSSRDHLAAQLHPTGDWGTTFAVQPVPRTRNFGDMVRVVARRANTVFTITFDQNPNPSQVTLTNPGDYSEFMILVPATIQSQNSQRELQVIQMVRSQAAKRISDVADPAMFLVVPQNQWLTRYVSPALTNAQDETAYTTNKAFIAVASGSTGTIRVNGGTINPGWTTLNSISMAWIEVGQGPNVFTSTLNRAFGVMVYGAADRESYGFALGADMTNSRCQESLMTRGDGLDNDCDTRVDEEECNEVDDDGDGLVDEDCEPSSIEAVGNSYVIMFMENNVDDNPNAQSFLEIYLSAVDSSATVNYNITNEFGSASRTINPGQVDIFTNLPLELRHTGSGIDTKAITIMADGDVVVYGINKQTFSTDGFLAFPTDVAGTEYYTAHYWPGQDLNEFAVTPVINDGTPTMVTVTMPTNTDNGASSNGQFGNIQIAAGQSYTFALSYGQTAQIQSASISDNLNGARISSSKPVAAFSGNVRARVDPLTLSSRDHLVQQLAPVNTWGQEFVTIPIPRESERGDIFIFTASAPNTIVTYTVYNEDSTAETPRVIPLSNAGQYGQFNAGGRQYVRVQSNHPIQLYQFVKTTADKERDNADPAMMLIPPAEQWSRNYQLQTPRTGQRNAADTDFEPFENYLMIAIATDQISGLRLDGNTLSTNWINLGGTPYSATVIEVTSGRHSLTHVDPAVFYEGLMYGRFDRESYALPLGLRLQTRQCVTSAQTAGDGLDNDCDGSVDEELCDGVDDDADGAIDEDCGQGLASGTNFYVTFMENTVEYPQDLDLELYVASVGSVTTQVNVRTPLVDFPAYNAMTQLEPGEVQAYGLAYTLRNVGQGITGNTIFVRTSSDVVVYGINKEKFSNDGFLVYPESSLGTNHYCVCWAPSTLNTEFAVVATQDSTTVTITLPNRANIQVQANGQTYAGGQQFQISLSRFQVYQGQSQGDLSGTRVQSNIRVALYSGNVRTLVELSASRDHLVQQMIPIGAYGQQFYVVPFPQRTVGDVLKIVASQANTQVRVDGALIGTINNAGGFLSYQLASNTRSVVTTTGPVMIAQFVKSQDGRTSTEEADPAMFLVPGQSNWITRATFITPTYSGGRVAGADYINYLTMVIQNGQQGNVRFNGNPLNNVNWVQISSSNFVTGTFEIPSGRAHQITTTSSSSFYGRLYGRADRESYSFPVGWSF